MQAAKNNIPDYCKICEVDKKKNIIIFGRELIEDDPVRSRI